MVRNFVSTELGSHYIVSPDFDLVGCFKEICDFVEPSLCLGAVRVFDSRNTDVVFAYQRSRTFLESRNQGQAQE